MDAEAHHQEPPGEPRPDVREIDRELLAARAACQIARPRFGPRAGRGEEAAARRRVVRRDARVRRRRADATPISAPRYPTASCRAVLGSIVLVVEHRNPGAEGGPTLRVRDSDGRELAALRLLRARRATGTSIRRAATDHPVRGRASTRSVDARRAARRSRRPARARGARRRDALPAREPAPTRSTRSSARCAIRPSTSTPCGPRSRRPSRGEKWTTYPDDVLPLWVADMDFPIAEPIRRVAALRGRALRPRLPDPPRADRHPGASTPRACSACTAGRSRPRASRSSPTWCRACTPRLHQFTEPGDGVVVQTPIYPPFLGSGRQAGPTARREPARGGRARLRDRPRRAARHRRRAHADPAAVQSAQPDRPRVPPRRARAARGARAAQRPWWVVADEIHQDLVSRGHRFVPFASLAPEVEARTITLTAGLEGVQHRRAALRRRRSSAATSSAAASARCRATCAAGSACSASRRSTRRGAQRAVARRVLRLSRGQPRDRRATSCATSCPAS